MQLTQFLSLPSLHYIMVSNFCWQVRALLQHQIPLKSWRIVLVVFFVTLEDTNKTHLQILIWPDWLCHGSGANWFNNFNLKIFWTKILQHFIWKYFAESQVGCWRREGGFMNVLTWPPSLIVVKILFILSNILTSQPRHASINNKYNRERFWDMK